MVAAVVAGRADLLGARLRNWLEAWRCARRLRAPLVVAWSNWDERGHAPYSVYSLLDREGLERIEGLHVEEVQLATRSSHPLVGASARAKSTWLAAESIDFSLPEPLPAEAVVLYRSTGALLPDSDPATSTEDDIAALFGQLPLHPDVRRAVEDTAGATADPFVAMHMRRGNLVEYLFEKTDYVRGSELSAAIRNFVPRYAHLGAYERAVAAHNANARLAIFSDDLELRALAYRMFGAQLLDVQRHLDAYALDPLQRAFAELLVMSRASAVISANSQFSTLPSLIGRVPRIDVRRWTSSQEVIDEIASMIDGATRQDVDPAAMRHGIFTSFYELYAKLGMPQVAAEFLTAANASPGSRFDEMLSREKR